jgi:mono/diheme cytochrome c family protein
MTKSLLLLSALTVLSAAAQADALPGDAAAGRKLHDTACMSCHNDSVYTRKDRHITSLDGLREQMNACGHMGNITLSKPQIDDLVKFLDEKYYHFK